jgi:hypothetical protein
MENIVVIYILVILNILRLLGILRAFGNFVVIWYIFPHFGVLYQKNLATLYTYT